MPTSTHPFSTISAVHDAFDRKEISALELTQGYLARARASEHNAYLLLSEERAVAQAKKADQIIASEGRVPRDRLPLLGIPLGIKDVLTIQGVRTTCASKIIANYVPPYTATCVERLENAGSVSLGKLNMDEFAMGGSNENSAFGPVKHPTHPDRVPGGSSGGSATAVAAQLAFATLGTDTGGSIRLPASFCGIVGFKPSYGRISRYGLIAFGSSLDQVGPMTQTVQDAAILTDIMSGADTRDSTCANQGPTELRKSLAARPDFKKLRIGIPQEYFVDGVSKEVQKSVGAAIDWYKAQGCFTEIIRYQTRLFVPIEGAASVIARLASSA